MDHWADFWNVEDDSVSRFLVEYSGGFDSG